MFGVLIVTIAGIVFLLRCLYGFWAESRRKTVRAVLLGPGSTNDHSTRYFFTAAEGVLKKEQNTATLGLVLWMGRKQGAGNEEHS